jgi:hypothetical protein
VSTHIHAGSRDDTTGVSFVLTGGHRHEAPGLEAIWAQLPQEPALEQAIMDRGDDRHHLRRSLQAQGMTPVIPPKHNRKAPLADDAAPDTLREKGERCFTRFTQVRRIATREDKLSQCFRAFLPLTAVWLMVK